MMQRVGARIWIARIMVVWGLVSMAMMFIKTVPMFYAMRFLLGAAEAGFFPGVILYLTYWYPAKETSPHDCALRHRWCRRRHRRLADLRRHPRPGRQSWPRRVAMALPARSPARGDHGARASLHPPQWAATRGMAVGAAEGVASRAARRGSRGFAAGTRAPVHGRGHQRPRLVAVPAVFPDEHRQLRVRAVAAVDHQELLRQERRHRRMDQRDPLRDCRDRHAAGRALFGSYRGTPRRRGGGGDFFRGGICLERRTSPILISRWPRWRWRLPGSSPPSARSGRSRRRSSRARPPRAASPSSIRSAISVASPGLTSSA